MPSLTLPRARRWSVALPLLAGGMALANGLWNQFRLPGWRFFDESNGYTTDSSSLALGVVFACYAGLAAGLAGTFTKRPVATGITIGWGVVFGAWFSYATFKLTYALFTAVPILDDLGGGTFAERMTGMALGVMGAGFATAALLWWMTGSRRVGGWCAAATMAAALLWYAYCLGEWAGIAPIVIWHTITALGLGRFVLEEARRRRAGMCPACGYSLAGLAPGTKCPECGLGLEATA